MRRWLLILMMLIVSAAIANGEESNLYPFAGKLIGPSEYCQFGGSIPKRFVEICEEQQPNSRQAENARATRSQRWVRIKADNGAEFAINVGGKGSPEPGIIAATMCQLDVDGRECFGGFAWVMNAKLMWFDCRGHYADVTHHPTSGWQVAPPESVIGRASELVCEQANTLPDSGRSQ